MLMTTVFIIAGFDIHNTAASDRYSVLENALRNKGYKIAASNISWKRKMPSQYAKEFINFYAKHKTEKNIIIGNSFGAVVAFISASATKPDELYLCSLSPFFKVDRGKRPDSYGIKIFGKQRMKDLWSISAKSIANKISDENIRTFITCGENEHQTSPTLVARCKETSTHIKHSRLIEIPNAPHNMADETYSEQLADLIAS